MATKKSSTAQRKTAAKKSVSKKPAVSLKQKSKWLNWKSIIAVILVVSIASGFWVWRSNASGYTFIKRASDMTDNSLTKKVDGISYKMLAGSPRADISATEARKSSRVCAHWKTLGSAPWGRIRIRQFVNGGLKMVSSDWVDWSNSKKSGNVCTAVKSNSKSVVRVDFIHMGGNLTPSIGVDTIYGKP